MSTGNAKIRKARDAAFSQQGGRCYYCEHPMWLDHPDEFSTRYKLSRRRTALFRCTAEHLSARKDGGSGNASNIVAACRFCNFRRHRRKTPLSPERFKVFVRERVRRGRWHGAKLPHSKH